MTICWLGLPHINPLPRPSSPYQKFLEVFPASKLPEIDAFNDVRKNRKRRPLDCAIVPVMEPNTTAEDHRQILAGSHPFLRIKGDQRRYEAEAPIFAAVITAATFALNWMLQT